MITTGANLSLAATVLSKNWRNRINVLFSLMLLSIAAWSFFLGMFYVASDLHYARLTSVPIYSSAALIAVLFYYFAYYFPFALGEKTLMAHIISFISYMMILFIIIFIHIETIVSYDLVTRQQVTIINPVGYTFFLIYFCYYIISAFYHLFKKLRSATAIHKKEIQVVVFSTLFAAVLGTLFNLAILGITYKYDWLGPFFTVIMVLIIARYIFFQNK